MKEKGELNPTEDRLKGTRLSGEAINQMHLDIVELKDLVIQVNVSMEWKIDEQINMTIDKFSDSRIARVVGNAFAGCFGWPSCFEGEHSMSSDRVVHSISALFTSKMVNTMSKWYSLPSQCNTFNFKTIRECNQADRKEHNNQCKWTVDLFAYVWCSTPRHHV